ncbi:MULTISPECIES: hypothetical protein [unclassified Bradyrhizobium]|nr:MULTISPECIES: hypothetical protein [unclassified Bradyrhizobium]
MPSYITIAALFPRIPLIDLRDPAAEVRAKGEAAPVLHRGGSNTK